MFYRLQLSDTIEVLLSHKQVLMALKLLKSQKFVLKDASQRLLDAAGDDPSAFYVVYRHFEATKDVSFLAVDKFRKLFPEGN